MVTEEELKNMSPEEIKKLQEENCIFCKISKKEIPSKIVYEDDIVCAFLDIQPVSMGHTVVVPKKHTVFFSQVPDEDTKHIFKVARSISQCMLKALQVGGTSIYIANGEAAGQFAPHVMIHIIPRRQGEDIPELHPVKEDYPDNVLEKVQKALVSRIEEVLGVDMKKVLETDDEDKSSKGKNKIEDDDIEEDVDDMDGNDSENLPEEKPEKENAERNKDDDIDLDKISKLFR